MAQEKEPILDPKVFGETSAALLNPRFEKMPPEEVVSEIEVAVKHWIGRGADEKIIELINVILKLLDKSKPLAYLIDFYWSLPVCSSRQAWGPDLGQHYPCKYVTVYDPLLTKLKLWVIEQVLEWWDGTESPDSIRAVQFVVASYKPVGNSQNDEMKRALSLSRYGEFSPVRNAVVVELFDKRLRRIFYEWNRDQSVLPIEHWVTRDGLPGEFVQQLANRRFEIGKLALVFHEIACIQILEPLRLGGSWSDRASNATIEFVKQQTASVVATETLLESLSKQMTLVEPPNRKADWLQVGSCDYVSGSISWSFKDAQDVIFELIVSAEYDVPLRLDMAGRARRHIERWRSEGGSKIKLLLRVFTRGDEKPIFERQL